MSKGQRNRNYRTAVRSTGIKVRVDASRLKSMRIPDPIPGEHLWGIYAMWVVTPTAYRAGEVLLGTEHLMTTSPGACLRGEHAETEPSCPNPLIARSRSCQNMS